MKFRQLCIAACALFTTMGRVPGQHVPRILLIGQPASIDVDPINGAITRIFHGPSGTVLEPPQGMAENFRLTLEKADKTKVTILGKDQKLSGGYAEPGQKNLPLHWDGPLKDTEGGLHDIAVRMDISAEGDSLEFVLHVENKTPCKVREALYPLIGGLTGFHPQGKPSDAKLWIPTSTPWEKAVTLPFGTASFAYPGQMNMSFCCLQDESAGRSLYISAQDTIARYKTYEFMELDGPAGAKDLFACIKHYPFTPQGGTFDGSPFVLRFISGDWRAAGEVYREWFGKTFGIAQPSDSWIRRESFFLMTMFMLPEGTINFSFRDIPKWAKAAKEHGINALQISGWQVGGHDNGYPYYTPDPRLGTWEELEEGIRACHGMGQKVYFFVNYQPVMLDLEWYKKELCKYREMKEDGGLTWNAGWGMGTLWARMDHPKKMTWMDLSFPQYRKIIADQFEKLAEIGADGVHVDKMFPTSIDYNPDIPMSPDTATWEGAILLTKEIMVACRKHQPDWAMSFECNWDRMLQFGGATWWVGNQAITRQVFPENAETLGLYDAYNYICVNNAVRGGHVVMVAPLSFCRNVDWPPFHGLAHYIQEVKSIRDKLQDTVFYGEIWGHEGVRVVGTPDDGVEYTVFRNRETGRRVCIVTNKSMTAGSISIAGIGDAAGGAVRIHAPGKRAKKVALPASIEIPGERIVFIEEMEGVAKSKITTTIPAPAEKKPVSTTPTNGALEESVSPLPKFNKRKSIKLENDDCLIEVSRTNGSLTRIRDKRGDAELILEPRLGASYRFALPIPGKEPWQTIEANWIFGHEQKLSSFESEPNKLTLHWAGPLRNYLGEVYDVSVAETIELARGGVLFNLRIENRSSLPVGETYFPVIGGIQGLGKTRGQLKATELVRPGADGSFVTDGIFRVFKNFWWLGDHAPEMFFAYPESQPEPWAGFSSSKMGRSVCVGALDPSNRNMVIRLELLPSSSGPALMVGDPSALFGGVREDGNWPRANELHGQPVGVELSFVDFANCPSSETYRAASVFLQFGTGGGPEMSMMYANWKTGK
jgi:hypothetical protein